MLIADFEHMFSAGFEKEVREIALDRLKDGSRHVLVYRIFEIEKNASEPRTLENLKKLYEQKEAIVFHSKFYKGAHDIPKLKEWFAEHGSGIFLEDVKLALII